MSNDGMLSRLDHLLERAKLQLQNVVGEKPAASAHHRSEVELAHKDVPSHRGDVETARKEPMSLHKHGGEVELAHKDTPVALPRGVELAHKDTPPHHRGGAAHIHGGESVEGTPKAPATPYRTKVPVLREI